MLELLRATAHRRGGATDTRGFVEAPCRDQQRVEDPIVVPTLDLGSHTNRFSFEGGSTFGNLQAIGYHLWRAWMTRQLGFFLLCCSSRRLISAS